MTVIRVDEPITELPGSIPSRRFFEVWNELREIVGTTGTIIVSSGVPTVPTTGNYVVTNIYVDAATSTLVYEFDNTPVTGVVAEGIPSNPTTGNYPITNIYVDAATDLLVYQFDPTPAP